MGSLSGRVVNRTRNAPVSGQEVLLLLHGASAGEETKAVSGEDGGFRFERVAQGDSASVVLMTTYLGVPYVVSQAGPVGQVSSDLEIAVYDTTSSDAAVRMEAYHIFANAHGPALDVVEILALINQGDRTIYRPDGTSLRVPLPQGFSALEVEPMKSTPTASGFASLWPFPPGKTRLRYRYRLPPGAGLSRPVPYPTSMVSLLVHPADLAVESRSLDNKGIVEFEGTRYLHLVGANVSRGAPVDFRVVEETREGSWLSRNTIKWGLVGLAVLLGAAAIFHRPRKTRVESGSAAGPSGADPAGIEHKRAEVLRRIAEIDEEYEAGRIDESAYRKRRAELKAEAMRLIEALRQGDG